MTSRGFFILVVVLDLVVWAIDASPARSEFGVVHERWEEPHFEDEDDF